MRSIPRPGLALIWLLPAAALLTPAQASERPALRLSASPPTVASKDAVRRITAHLREIIHLAGRWGDGPKVVIHASGVPTKAAFAAHAIVAAGHWPKGLTVTFGADRVEIEPGANAADPVTSLARRAAFAILDRTAGTVLADYYTRRGAYSLALKLLERCGAPGRRCQRGEVHEKLAGLRARLELRPDLIHDRNNHRPPIIEPYAAALTHWGRLLQGQRKNFQRAEALLRRAVKLAPRDFEATLHFCIALASNGRLVEAEALLREALAKSRFAKHEIHYAWGRSITAAPLPRGSTSWSKAEADAWTTKFDLAIAQFKKAAAANPRHYPTLLALARAEDNRARIMGFSFSEATRALAVLDRAITAYPSYPDLYLEKMRILSSYFWVHARNAHFWDQDAQSQKRLGHAKKAGALRQKSVKSGKWALRAAKLGIRNFALFARFSVEIPSHQAMRWPQMLLYLGDRTGALQRLDKILASNPSEALRKRAERFKKSIQDGFSFSGSP